MTEKNQGVEIKELKLKLGNKEVTLTVEQAKKLKTVLEELFGKGIVREEHYHHDHYSYYPWRWCDAGTIPDSVCDSTVYCMNHTASAQLIDNTLTLNCTGD